ncbi:hypothetical protein [Novosphingobium resinovorum]|uniref:hypothetical protein n=1 Tax=Novosphingobium resinovorum TaxID=158500 RepID=UPI002ED03935|nr:hypothetical protein [Novosphingobium resinovorum]
MSGIATEAPDGRWEQSVARTIACSRLAQFACLLAFAVLIRCPAWGEWNFGIDDQFYALVGERLLHGELLYVDIWDRKGPLLYLIFSGIALISPTMLAYQVGGTLSAALGAYGVNRIARHITTPLAALAGGLVYLALLSRFQGENLQAGVFVNTAIIGAACALVSRLPLLRSGRIDALLCGGFLLAGMAIATKQTAAVEGVVFGLAASLLLLRSGRPLLQTLWRIALLGAAGALPLLATGLFYQFHGHFPELWSALVTSNVARGYADPGIRLERVFVMAGMLGIPLFFAVLGFMSARARMSKRSPVLWLVAAWSLATLVLLFSFPNIYVHYGQPTLPPLAILCAAALVRKPVWPALTVLIGLSLILSGTFHLHDRWRARAAEDALADYVDAASPHKRIVVWGAASYLYSKVGAAPMSVLAFPPHFYEGREWTGIDEVAELRRVFAARPETVVEQNPLFTAPLNETTMKMMRAYTAHCGARRLFTIYDHNGEQTYTVFTRCGG